MTLIVSHPTVERVVVDVAPGLGYSRAFITLTVLRVTGAVSTTIDSAAFVGCLANWLGFFRWPFFWDDRGHGDRGFDTGR